MSVYLRGYFMCDYKKEAEKYNKDMGISDVQFKPNYPSDYDVDERCSFCEYKQFYLENYKPKRNGLIHK